MSIEPEFVAKIFSGEKRFEYRKAIFSNEAVKTVVIYSTMPIGRVVGEFEVNSILTDSPEEVWKKTKELSGIKESFLNEYFDGRDKAYAIKIEKAIMYENPKDLSEVINRKVPPQSFCYI
nr:ASCH domain-containing protein [Pedobacter xinjiangensis]